MRWVIFNTLCERQTSSGGCRNDAVGSRGQGVSIGTALHLLDSLGSSICSESQSGTLTVVGGVAGRLASRPRDRHYRHYGSMLRRPRAK